MTVKPIKNRAIPLNLNHNKQYTVISSEISVMCLCLFYKIVNDDLKISFYPSEWFEETQQSKILNRIYPEQTGISY